MSRDNTRIEDYSVDRSMWELTFISIYSLHLRMASLLRRQVVIPLLILLVLTAPFSWPLYTTFVLMINLVTGFLAHTAFR